MFFQGKVASQPIQTDPIDGSSTSEIRATAADPSAASLKLKAFLFSIRSIRQNAQMNNGQIFAFGETANPRKTRTAWLRRRISSSSSRPTRCPILDFGTVVILSTITRQCARKPFTFSSFGSTAKRNKGASVSSVVNAQMVVESVASKASSCKMMTGRGLPA